MAYNMVMVEIRQTEVYARWFRRLRNREARVRIDNRIKLMSLDAPNDVRLMKEEPLAIRLLFVAELR